MLLAVGRLLLGLSTLTASSVLRCATAGHAALVPDATTEEQGRRALVVSGLGPDSRYGCGVREFIFMLDLQECGYRVDIVTEEGGGASGERLAPVHERFGWSTRTPEEAFRDVRWFNRTDAVDLEGYSAIFFFGWYWEFQKKGGEEGLEMAILPKLVKFRDRTTLMLDDVPDVRCEEETGGQRSASFCRTVVPKAVARWAAVSKQVLTLTEEDAGRVAEMYRSYGVSDPGPVRVWPLRLQRLQQLQREEGLAVDGEEPSPAGPWPGRRSYLTMVANDHAANREFTDRMLASGAAQRWCNKSISLVFVGTISEYIESLKLTQPGLLPSDCLLTAGVQSRTVLAQRILPRTLAVLNPFWRDLRSGISVKSHEALAAGIPLVTSVHGLRGLESCGAADLALGMKEADDPDEYADFVDRLLLDPTNYALLTARALRLRSACIEEQERSVSGEGCGLLQ